MNKEVNKASCHSQTHSYVRFLLCITMGIMGYLKDIGHGCYLI